MHIVITGASKGIGFAIAKKFADDKQGHTIYICSREEESLKRAAIQLQARFPRSNIYHKTCDMSNTESILSFAKWLLNFQNAIDVLVNNAGQFVPGSVHNEPEGALEKMIEVNVYSAYHLTRALLPKMMQQQGGHIFNMCSIASLKAYDNGGAYSISKFALAGFTKNLREEMKPHNIKVTAVYPGATMSDSWSGANINPKRIMEAEDIAQLIYTASFLSPQACVEDIIVRPQLGDL